MLSELLARIRSLGSSAESEPDADDADENRFAGSLLDLSVFVGHGGSAAGDRELESVAREADRLSEADDHER